MIINMGGGGVGIAHILANVPPSSTVTASNGSTILTVTNSASSRANVAFAVPTTGTWTITASRSGYTSASTTVSVSEGGAYYVQLYFTIAYLIENAVVKVAPHLSDNSIVQNKDGSSHDIDPVSRGAWRYSTIGGNGHHFVQWGTIDVTNVNRVVFQFAASGRGTGVAAYCPNEIGLTSSSINTGSEAGTNAHLIDWYSCYESLVMKPNTGVVTFDVSAQTGSKYITLGWEACGGWNVFFDLSNVYYQM